MLQVSGYLVHPQCRFTVHAWPLDHQQRLDPNAQNIVELFMKRLNTLDCIAFFCDTYMCVIYERTLGFGVLP